MSHESSVVVSLTILHTMWPIPNGDEEDSNLFGSGTVPKYATITVAHLVKVANLALKSGRPGTIEMASRIDIICCALL